MTRPGEPACSSWPATRPGRDGIDTTGYGEKVLELLQGAAGALDTDRTVLTTWQADRCAVCGRTDHRLVLDHDHITGLVRGWLCVSCNTREGAVVGPGSVFALYRDSLTGQYAMPAPPRMDGTTTLPSASPEHTDQPRRTRWDYQVWPGLTCAYRITT